MTGLFYVCMRVWSCIVPDTTLDTESNPLRIFGVKGPAFLPSKQVVDLQNWQLRKACKRSKDRYWRTTGTAKAFRYRNLRWNGDELKLKNEIFLKE